MQTKHMDLLVSVRDLAEANITARANVDIIDIKEPSNGPLGRAEIETIVRISEQHPNQNVSAALGELSDCQDLLSNRGILQRLAQCGLAFAKCGLANTNSTDWQSAIATVWRHVASFANPVAVAYADAENANSPQPSEILDHAISCGVKLLLLDTYGKDGRSSLDHLPDNTLLHLTNMANNNGIKFVLAGSISKSHLIQLKNYAVDCVAIRGAACKGKRTATISQKLLDEFQIELHRINELSIVDAN